MNQYYKLNKKSTIARAFSGSNISGETRFEENRANLDSYNSGRITILIIAGESRFAPTG